MRVDKYIKFRKRGSVELKRIGAGYMITTRQWDPGTGEETLPEVEGIDLAALKRQRQEQAEVLENMDALVSDLEALA